MITQEELIPIDPNWPDKARRGHLQLSEVIKTLGTQLTAQHLELEELKQKQNKTSRNSHKPPSSDYGRWAGRQRFWSHLLRDFVSLSERPSSAAQGRRLVESARALFRLNRAFLARATALRGRVLHALTKLSALKQLVKRRPCCLMMLLYALLSLNACTLVGLANRGHVSSKLHLTAAASTTLQGAGISPSAELGLYSIYGRYGYKGAKIFDFAEQLLVGYQNKLFDPAPTIITSYSNNAGFLGFGLSHEVESAHSERQYFGGRLMFFGPTYTTNIPYLYFEVLGYVGGKWSLYDEGSAALFGLSVRLHYQLNERAFKRHDRAWSPPPPRRPLTPEEQHHMRAWRIKNIRNMIDYQSRESLVKELERLEREEDVYQDALKAGN